MDEEKGKKVKVLKIEEDSLIKPLDNGTSIVIKYDFVRNHIPELQGKTDEEVKGILRELPQKELEEIFAGGMYQEVKETTEKIIPGAIVSFEKRKAEEEKARREAEEKARQEAEERARKEAENKKELEEKQKKEEEKNRKRRLLVVPIFLFVGSLSLSGLLRGCHNDRSYRDETTEETTEKKGDTDKTDDEEITQSQYLEFTLYKPDDSTQNEKANVDYGNQESESNHRKEGSSTNGDKEWEMEKQALQNYSENQKNIEEMEKYRQIILSDTATDEEKMDAFNKMLDLAHKIADSFDSERMEEETDYAVKESRAHPDEITEQEVENAKRLLEEYKTQEQCQKENEDILMYIQYLRDNGYDISGIETTQNTRGDIGIKLVCERTIQQSKANPGSKSFEEFKQELDEHVDSGKDKRSFLEEFEAEEAESDLSETIELTDGATISYKIQDYKRLASSRNPKNVQNETKKFSESISTKDKIDEERI